MLNVTSNSDGTILTISHPNLTTAADLLTLEVAVDCASSLPPFNFLSKVPSVTSNSFTIVPADIYPTDTPDRFPDGVYYWKITFKYPVGKDDYQYVSTKCMFIDYVLKCTIDIEDEEFMKKYKALQYATDCDSCTCTKLCNLFSSLTNTTVTHGSGCSGCD